MTVIFRATVLEKGVLPNAIATASRETSKYAVKVVKARTPVDTGRLRGAWTTKLEPKGFQLINPTYYAKFVEFGTRKMRPRRMVERSEPEILKKFEQELLKRLK